MAVDPRHVLAGFLTLTMFVMLGHMIKRDHFDSIQEKNPDAQDARFDDAKVSQQSHVTVLKVKKGPWTDDGQELKTCWTQPSLDEEERSKGFVVFSLSTGPEFHISQIADAVVVARYLGATLVLPDIRGSKPTDTRKFEDIYDVEKFIRSLDGVVRVALDQPAEITAQNLPFVRVPNRVTDDYIANRIEPIFRTKGTIRLVTYFTSANMRKSEEKSNLNSVACLATFATLELKPEVQEVVDSMVERLRTLSRRSDGQFIAVDLRAELLEKKGCHGKTKNCYSAQEIAVFLSKIGFDKDATIYLTQSRWDNSLDALKELFPKTYTKEGIMPADKKAKFLSPEASEFEKVIDFYVCSQSEVFVPAISGLFYANVAGKRIASGKTQILVPAYIPGSSASSNEFISRYVSEKNHLAYSCFC